MEKKRREQTRERRNDVEIVGAAKLR